MGGASIEKICTLRACMQSGLNEEERNTRARLFRKAEVANKKQ